MSGARIVEAIDFVAKTVVFQARHDLFAHFAGGPDVVVTAGHQEDGAGNLLDGDRGACDCHAIAQARAK